MGTSGRLAGPAGRRQPPPCSRALRPNEAAWSSAGRLTVPKMNPPHEHATATKQTLDNAQPSSGHRRCR
eukprot:9165469-Heterocapsa_arctica.AAC.1